MANLEKRLKIMQGLGIFGIRRLVKVGSSEALVLPRAWINVCALKVGKGNWVKLSQTLEGNIQVSSLTEEELEGIELEKES